MIEETKVNENTEFDTYDGKEDSPKLKLTDKKVESGFGEYGEENGLSPNPDGSGYVKQINAAAKPENPEENVLYVINDVKWKWTVEEGWLRVFENPSLKTIDGGRGTPVKENQPPRKRPRVFSEPVAFQDDVFYKGKLLGEGGGSSGGKKYVHNIIFFDQYNRKIYAFMPIIDEDPDRVDSYYKLYTKLIQLGATSINDAFPIAGVDFSGAELLPGVYAIIDQNNIGVINDGVLNRTDGQVLSTIKDLVYAI